MTASADLPGRPPRIPKLTYRNQLPSPDLDSSSSDLSVPLCPSTFTAESVTSSLLSRSSTVSSASSLASFDDSTSNAPRASSKSKKKKKKKNGVLGFLSVKEPSQVALEQFMKQQQRQRTAPKTTVGLQTISTQKLPPTVPKVNSKWDGTPGAVKPPRTPSISSHRSSSSSHGGHSMRGFGFGINTSASSIATVASRGPPPSLSSVVDVTGRTFDSASETSSLSSQSISPPLPETFRHTRSPPPAPQGAETREGRPTSKKGPVDPTDERVNTKADGILRKIKSHEGFLAGEAKEIFSEDKEEDVRESAPETLEFLFDFQTGDGRPMPTSPTSSSSSSPPCTSTASPPSDATQDTQPADRPARTSPNNFSRPRPFCLPSQSTSSSLPTLYEMSHASTETITELSEITTTRTSMDTDLISISESVAPSVMSASWYRSSKDRLGLGSRISKSESLPWEDDRSMDKGKPRRGRLSVFSKKL